uniref:Uncharacterized protein n=1 Tax=Setaria viridis TaxID=4556 RepID=A0A4U6W9L9_SETVI|nr:hypothetical protein SEVIR_1G101950v2 [Setaria viridis]
MVSSSGCELSSDDNASCAADNDVHMEWILTNSSHRDGSIYSGTTRWKKDFRIADLIVARLVRRQ